MLRPLFLLLALLLPLSAARAQTNAEYVLWLGQQALSVDDYLGAIRHFTSAIEAKPHQALPYYYRAYAKFTLEDYHGADTDCTRALDRNPYLSEVYPLRGLCRINLSDYAGAAEDYSRILRDDPHNQGYRFNRALCYYEQKMYDEADADLLYVLHRTPSYYRAQMVRAQILMERGDTLSALAQVDAVLQKTDKEPSAWSLKGRYALIHDDYLTADTCLSHALALNTKDFENYLARAAARHGLNRFDQAIADYDSCLVLVPEHFVAHYNRGLLRSFVGDLNRAIEDFDFVLGIEPDNLLAHYNRAELRMQTGDFAGAVEDYTTMLNEYPDFLYGYQQRSIALRALGKNKAAVQDETRVARANLDLRFGKTPRRVDTSKKVRLRSEHELDKYQQLVEEDPDTLVRRGGNYTQLYGKVQNINVSGIGNPVGPFALYVCEKTSSDAPLTTPAARGFMAEAEHTISTYALHFERIANSAYEEVALATGGRQLVEPDALTPYATDSLLPLMQCAAKALQQDTDAQHVQQALTYTTRAAALAPSSAYLQHNIAYLLALLDQREEAEKAYSRAIESDAGLAAAYYNRALLYVAEGKVEAARADFSRAGELGFYPAYAAGKQLLKKEQTP